MRFFRSCLVLLLIASCSLSAKESVSVTLSAGKHDRLNEPVCVSVELPSKTPLDSLVELRDRAGKTVAMGQLTPPRLGSPMKKASASKQRLELCWIMPVLKADQKVELQALIDDTKKAPKGFHWVEQPAEHSSELRLGDRSVLRYLHPELDESSKQRRDLTFKPFHHVFDPQGKTLLTNGPEGKFPHHRGLFYGFMRCGYDKHTVDTWHCRGDAHQAHRALRSTSVGPVLGRHLAEIDWNGVGKKTFARELRELTVWNVPGGTLIEFRSLLTPTAGPVKLDGDPQHAGFHFRAGQDVEKKTEKQTIFIRPDGTDKPNVTRNWDGKKNTTHINLPWLAMSFLIGEQRYTAAYLDHPHNPKDARFSERAYGRFGSYFVKTITNEEPLLVNYRLWVQQGQMKPEEVARLSRAFVEPISASTN